MHFRPILTTACVALVALGSVTTTGTLMGATLSAESSASAVSAAFTVNGKSGKLAPQLPASGTGSTAYSKTVTKPSLSANQTFDILTLAAKLNSIKDTASSLGPRSGTIVSSSSAKIGSLSGTIGSPIGTALTASSSELVSSAKLVKATAKNTATGAATITNLSISSAFFGINKTYTGTPTPNTILYQSSDKKVTVYLNRQVTKSTSGKVTSVAVSAVNLHVVNFSYSGQTVSGDLYLATSGAK